jgi:hypothetical protein
MGVAAQCCNMLYASTRNRNLLTSAACKQPAASCSAADPQSWPYATQLLPVICAAVLCTGMLQPPASHIRHSLSANSQPYCFHSAPSHPSCGPCSSHTPLNLHTGVKP